MSERHTRDPELDGGLMDGHALVPSIGWVGSIMPGGRHRTEICGVEWDDRDDSAIPRGWGYSCQREWEHNGLHRCDDFEWVK